jgi:hypothetical protein
MEIFDGILDSDDLAWFLLVNNINHGSQCRGLAASGDSRNQNQA